MSNTSDMQIAVILPAAGRSRRFAVEGRDVSKLDVELAGRTVLMRAIELFTNRSLVSQILVAVDPDRLDAFQLRWGDKLSFMGVRVVAGGRQERWETVRNALAEIDPAVTHIAVHDAARPVTDRAMIDRVFEAAGRVEAVIPAVACSATLKRAVRDESAGATESDPLDAILGDAGKPQIDLHRVTETVPRDGLWLVQTPQVFSRALLVRAYEQIGAGNVDTAAITDDAQLVEQLGQPVYIVPGDPTNIKITHPPDVELAQAILTARQGGGSGEDPLGSKRKFPTWAEMDED
jgi:2-C-methyl-D-erythritol 4-phosphate cytidylyltransferase